MKFENPDIFAKEIILELIKNGRLKPTPSDNISSITFAKNVKTLYVELINQFCENEE